MSGKVRKKFGIIVIIDCDLWRILHFNRLVFSLFQRKICSSAMQNLLAYYLNFISLLRKLYSKALNINLKALNIYLKSLNIHSEFLNIVCFKGKSVLVPKERKKRIGTVIF